MTAPSTHLAHRLVLGLAIFTLAAFAAIAGFLVRPLVIDDAGPATSAPPPLSAVEVGFLQDMLGHHQQAVAMGKLIDRPGVDDAVRTLGRQIAVTQQFEMGTMSGWLRMQDAPLANPTPMDWMTRYGAVAEPHAAGQHDQVTGAHEMPGMATADELAALGTMPARAAEDQFLKLMQAHHYGGIAMAQDLTARSPNGLVAQLAAGMVSTQSKETALIGVMLNERGIHS